MQPSHRPRRSRPLAATAATIVAVSLGAAACSSSAAGETGAAAAVRPSRTHHVARHDDAQSSAEVQLRLAMRKLWEDHITWTRLFIIAAEAGTPDAGTVAARLLQNQVDIGDALAPVYGRAAGDRLTALLRQHILVAGDLIAAAKAGDAARATATEQHWYANANEIADFLAAANPHHWPRGEMRHMMREHLDNTLAEAVDHLQSRWAADVADYDKVHVQILQMADMLTDGIVAQFPAKFS
jgi:hypothetical protein